MRLVPSPTSRLLVIGLLAGLAATLFTSTAANADSPDAPGNFTGYGFDACVAPSQSVMNTWNLRSPYSAIGIYVSGNSRYCGDKYQPNLSKAWVAKNAAKGWRFMPIHVGYQAPCFKNNPASRVQKKKMSSKVSKARSQARSDAAETIAALKKYGFGAGSTSYLDIEWYARTKACDNVVLEFADAWTEALHDKGYQSGVYASGSAAIVAIDAARKSGRKGFTLPDHMWLAWGNKVANTDGGPYLNASGWKNHQRIHQYHLDVSVTYGGAKLNIDKNFLDVGKGSVARKDAQPCGVPMSFSSYPRLELGDTGPAVSALQCLLKQQGHKKSINGIFGNGTRKGVDAFRVKMGWRAVGHTTKPTWTALLSDGNRPRVLKQGSVGEPVWRLQRALAGAGLKPRMTGVYDSKTVSAVKAYRKANKLSVYTTTESSVWSLLQSGRAS